VHQRGGGPYFDAPMIKNGEMNITDVITDNALGFIDKQRESDKPFYLSNTFCFS
jgi:choline-sulfatase